MRSRGIYVRALSGCRSCRTLLKVCESAMNKFYEVLPSVKNWGFPAAFLAFSWLWQCLQMLSSRHTIQGAVALLLFGISFVCLIALVIAHSFPRPCNQKVLLVSTLMISITLCSAVSLRLSSQGPPSSESDTAYKLSCLYLTSLATPVLLNKLVGNANKYAFIGSMTVTLAAVIYSCQLNSSSSHTAYTVVCMLITLCLSTSDILGGIGEEAEAKYIRPVTTLKDPCAPLIGLVANAAHDLKTPLVSFMVGVDNALEALFNAKQMLEIRDCKCPQKNSVLTLLSSMEMCMSNCKRTNQFMLMIINRMMDSAKAARGLKLSPKYETLSLLEAIKLPLECVRNLKSDIPIVLEKIPDDICRYIISDKQWLQENLLALLTNAVKYSNGGTVSLRVVLEYYKGPKGRSKAPLPYLRFEVEDEGIGMTDEASENLFNPFQQNQRLAGGTGLGLFSLSKRTEALNGSCGVQKRRDQKQGSLFWFTIRYRPDESHLSDDSCKSEDFSDLIPVRASPQACVKHIHGGFGEASEKSFNSASGTSHSSGVLVPAAFSYSMAEDTEMTAVDPMSSLSEDKSSTGKPRVLLVDDTTSIVKMTAMMLRMHDFNVTVAMNGAAAIDLVEDYYAKATQYGSPSDLPFDIILMDLQMPIMDGIEATRRLRRWEADGVTSRGKRVTRGKSLKIIGLSANSDDEVLEETKKVGFDGFIPKPFSVKSLIPFLE